MNNMLEKIFFNPGEIVILKHDLPNKPFMYVVEKVTKIYNKNQESPYVQFVGIRCRWFDSNHVLREAVFSSKDLEHVG